MSNKNLNLETLRNHLFETLEGVKNLSDEEASPCEKTSIDQAKAIVDISGKIIDSYKLELDAIKLASTLDNMDPPGRRLKQLGFCEE